MGNLFAEPEMYRFLSAQLRARFKGAGAEQGLRAWVAGCGTGEDAYATAILLSEAAAHTPPPASVMVFASEDDGDRLTVARAGDFPAALLAHLGPEQYEPFFFTVGERAFVKAALRERVLFAAHRLLGDPPFSRLDLIVCRDPFRALASADRAAALDRFAFALQPGGLMLLGAAPPDDEGDPRFRVLDRDSWLYLRTNAPARPPDIPLAEPPLDSRLAPRWEPAAPLLDVRHPALIVDGQLQIATLGPGAERFLRLVSGTPSYHLPAVILPELRAALVTTVARARSRRRMAESQPILLSGPAGEQLVTLVVEPLTQSARGDGELMILFDAASPADAASAATDQRAEPTAPMGLAELQVQHDIVYEELRVANEELQAINQELRISTEELETRREELQTLNEQLQLVNAEQQRTLAALARTNADLQNLIASAQIGTLFLDRDLRLQRYTAPVQQIFNLLTADLGRPLAHLTHQLAYAGLLEDAELVLEHLTPVEREARHQDGRWFMVRLRPYRTAEQEVTGVVLVFLDISERKAAEGALRRSHEELERRVAERTVELVQANAARQTLLRELVQAQEAERLRIARELHDTLGQQITAVLLGLQSIKGLSHGRAATLQQMEQIWEIVQAMGREMHEIAVNLRPTSLDDIGLAEALRAYVEGWSRRTGIATQLYVAGVQDKSLSPEVETTLYRVAQEALTNVARHARATRVSVVLEGDGSRVVAAIEDNGRGFDVDAAYEAPQQRRHLGLLGMRERAALVGGMLTVESEPGGGTTIIARIPIAVDQETQHGHNQDLARRRS